MSDSQIGLLVAGIWFSSFLLVRFTIRAKNEGRNRSENIDEVLSCVCQLFAPFAIVFYPFILFIAIPTAKFLVNADKILYSGFRKLLLALSK